MIEPDPKYLDYTASTPPYPEPLGKYLETSAKYCGIHSSMHISGCRAGKIVNLSTFNICTNHLDLNAFTI